MHLADAFIHSDLQCIQAIHFFYQYVCSLGIEPTTFCVANAMLNWATGTHLMCFMYIMKSSLLTVVWLLSHDLPHMNGNIRSMVLFSVIAVIWLLISLCLCRFTVLCLLRSIQTSSLEPYRPTTEVLTHLQMYQSSEQLGNVIEL